MKKKNAAPGCVPRRITATLRDEIAQRLVKYSHRPAVEKAREDLMKVGDRIYNHLVPRSDRDLIDTLPSGFMVEMDSLRMSVPCEGGGFKSMSVHMSERRRLPHTIGFGQCEISVSLGKQLRSAHQANKRAKLDMETALAEARQTIAQFRTVGALIKAWPEIEPFIPEPEGGSKALITIPDNTKFKLPVKGKAAAELAASS